MATEYRVELGINLKAATMPRTNPNMRLFPLQDALVNVTDADSPKPAWYTGLKPGDTMTFRLVDISNLSQSDGPMASYPTLVLADFIFTDPNLGNNVSPFVEQVTGWTFGERQLLPSPAYSLNPDQKLLSWDICPENANGATHRRVELAKPKKGDRQRFVNLAVVIWAKRDGFIDQFIFDPEIIINEADGGKGETV